MENKHTPGPWQAEDSNVFSSTNTLRIADCDCDGQEDAMTEEETYANARLIAAAPEMLYALHLALGTIQRLKPPTDYDSTQGTRDVINTAIAKAEGK